LFCLLDSQLAEVDGSNARSRVDIINASSCLLDLRVSQRSYDEYTHRTFGIWME